MTFPPGADLELHLGPDGPDVTARLYRELRRAVRDGRLRPGDRLPPTRALATRLAVSRGTVTTAYERLLAEGFLTARVGAGTYVAQDVPGVPAPGRRRPGAVRPRPGWTARPEPVSRTGSVAHDFGVGVPDPHLFPFDTWRRLVAVGLRAGAASAGRYADPAGETALRQALARHVAIARSVRCDPDDVVVTNGTQHALDLLRRVVLDPGDVVAVEEPGYPPAAALFAAGGLRVRSVPVDTEGLVVDRLPDAARLVYVTPSHQFPTGVAMSLRRRAALVDWAARHDALVVEDDYDSEFRLTARPLEPLVNLDPSGRVAYVGSFSKTMFPGVRLGFAVVPPSLRDALRAARQLGDGFSPVATQLALTRFLDEGLLARHVRRASGVYARRHAAVLAALAGVDRLCVVPSAAGLHVCARLPDAAPGTGRSVVAAARREDVLVEDLAAYYREPPSADGAQGVVVGFGAVDDAALEEGLRRLVRVLRRVTAPS